MKAIFYTCLLLGALLLPASKGLRDGAIVLIKAMATGIEQLVIRGDYAEIRMVDGDEFDMAINEPGRLVIVAIQNEMKTDSRSEARELDEAIKRLPAKVLVAKVIAERNAPLLAHLEIPAVPTMRIYNQGKMVKEFNGTVNNDEFLRVVQHYLDNPTDKARGDAYMGPMRTDWMPDGVQKRGGKTQAPTTPLE
jgi:thioredoxin-like negative regulator of GroEL